MNLAVLSRFFACRFSAEKFDNIARYESLTQYHARHARHALRISRTMRSEHFISRCIRKRRFETSSE